MKKILILFFTVLFSVLFNLYSIDSTSDEKNEKKFPGVLGPSLNRIFSLILSEPNPEPIWDGQMST